jgi:sarcosine oxidase, subunit beta
VSRSHRDMVVIGGGLQGSADIDTQRCPVEFAELAKGAQAAADLHPAVKDVRIMRSWARVEAATKDLLPVIGPSPNASGVIHAFGFSGHGLQLVPVVGAIICDLVAHDKTGHQVDAFRAQRLRTSRMAA